VSGGAIPLATAVALVIDVQEAFWLPDAPRLHAEPEAPALRLIAAWRTHGGAVIHVRHDSVEPGSPLAASRPGNVLRPGFEPQPGEPLLTKSVNSAFIGTDLDLWLRRLGATTIVACGVTSDRCVSTTVRMGANMGYRMIVAEDACSAFDEPGLEGGIIPGGLVHAVHMATLAAEFAEVAKVSDIVARVAG
jgi:nicotinamidase-related amidase